MPQELFPIMLGMSYELERRLKNVRDTGCCFAVVGIRWALILPHEAQAQLNHGQSLKRLAERGGLAPCEALAILEDRPWKRMEPGKAHAQLADYILRANSRTKDGEVL